MATNRTATTRWRKIRDERRAIALEQGIHNCPRCKAPLDWEYSRRPNSAEVDHIKAHSQGGLDELSNTQILCRQCNQSLGGKQGAKNKAKPKPLSLHTAIEW